jgi:AcrR family transcriptional regulator
MDVFWRRGYEGSSLSDLTAAMGINSPSLYAAFGNKEGLFRAVLDRYDEKRRDFLDRVLKAPTAREVAKAWLDGVAEFASDPKNLPGCLLVQSGLSCGDKRVPTELAARRALKEQALKERFDRARAEGDLPKGADPAGLARYVSTVSNGMAVQASAGASADELRDVARFAIAAWPGEETTKRVRHSEKLPRRRAEKRKAVAA